MYVPDEYQAPTEMVKGWLRRPGLADVVTHGTRFLTTAVPLVHVSEEGGLGRFLGHLDRRNPQWYDNGGRAQVILRGPDGYISPQWRMSGDGASIPSWDFERLTASGRFLIHDDPLWVEYQLRLLVALYEPGQWQFGGVGDPAVQAYLRTVMGFEIVIEDISAQARLGQTRDSIDQARIVAELRADGNTALAYEIEQHGSPGPVV